MEILREKAGSAWCTSSGIINKPVYPQASFLLAYLYTYTYIFDVHTWNSNKELAIANISRFSTGTKHSFGKSHLLHLKTLLFKRKKKKLKKRRKYMSERKKSGGFKKEDWTVARRYVSLAAWIGSNILIEILPLCLYQLMTSNWFCSCVSRTAVCQYINNLQFFHSCTYV